MEDTLLHQHLTQGHPNVATIREFLEMLAVCHTVIPETVDGAMRYQAASPGTAAPARPPSPPVPRALTASVRRRARAGDGRGAVRLRVRHAHAGRRARARARRRRARVPGAARGGLHVGPQAHVRGGAHARG